MLKMPSFKIVIIIKMLYFTAFFIIIINYAVFTMFFVIIIKGKQPRTLPENFDHYYRLWLARSMSRSQIARELKISRPVLLKLMRQYEDQIKKEAAMETSQTKADLAE